MSSIAQSPQLAKVVLSLNTVALMGSPHNEAGWGEILGKHQRLGKWAISRVPSLTNDD
jgi:hypothetical protein